MYERLFLTPGHIVLEIPRMVIYEFNQTKGLRQNVIKKDAQMSSIEDTASAVLICSKKRSIRKMA